MASATNRRILLWTFLGSVVLLVLWILSSSNGIFSKLDPRGTVTKGAVRVQGNPGAGASSNGSGSNSAPAGIAVLQVPSGAGEASATVLSSFHLDDIHCKKYRGLIEKHAKNFGINPRIVAAIMMAESACKPEARSHVGALGLMQVMPDPSDAFRNPHLLQNDISYNIRSGAKIFRDFYDIVVRGIGVPNQTQGESKHLLLALASYNAGPTRVQNAGWEIPGIQETIDYVPRVIRFFSRYGGGPVLIAGGRFGPSGTGPVPRIGRSAIVVDNEGINPREGEPFEFRMEAWNLGEEAQDGSLVLSFPAGSWEFLEAKPVAGKQACSLARDEYVTVAKYSQKPWPRKDPEKDIPHSFAMKVKPLHRGRLTFTARVEIQWKDFGRVKYPERGAYDTSEEAAPAITQIVDVD